MPLARCFSGYDIETLPVQVVRFSEEEGWKCDTFENLTAAKAVFPTLDPEHNGKDFTWAVRGEVNGEIALRFENWEAEKHLSI